MSAAVRLEGLARRYGRASARALDGIDLELARGSWTAFVGRSGAGKTTLLQLLAGLDRPDAGRLWVFDQEVTEASEATWTNLRRERIGIVYQEPLFLQHLSVWRNVTCRLVPQGVAAGERRERAHRALARLDVEHALDRAPSQLSGGERQRVALARATIAEPELLILDEPTSNVDEATGARILEHLAQLHAAGATLVAATHDEALTAHADRTCTLESGRLVPR